MFCAQLCSCYNELISVDLLLWIEVRWVLIIREYESLISSNQCTKLPLRFINSITDLQHHQRSLLHGMVHVDLLPLGLLSAILYININQLNHDPILIKLFVCTGFRSDCHQSSENSHQWQDEWQSHQKASSELNDSNGYL